MSIKHIAAWIAGAIFLVIGVWIVSNLEFTIGVSEFSYAFALLIAFLFFLVAGLCWITVAVATRRF